MTRWFPKGSLPSTCGRDAASVVIIAECREQWPVRIRRLVFCLCEGWSAQAAEYQQDRRADCFQEGSPVVAAVSALNRLLRPATMQAAVPGNDPPVAGVDSFRW